VAKEALATGRPVRDIIRERGYLEEDRLQELLAPEAMIRPRQLA